MRTVVLVAVLLAMTAVPGFAASRSRGQCYTPADLEAEQAIRFMTDVMVISSTCRDTVYAEFRLRNRRAIIHYQEDMIRHFHSRRAFDTWNTNLANQAAMKEAGVPTTRLCQRESGLLKQASLLDPQSFHKFAATKAASVSAQYRRCRR